MSDSDLITRAAGGDPAAFQTLVERHRSMVYRIAYQFAGNHHDAEDITQEVFIKVYRSLGGFRHGAQVTSWLYRIVMNACIDHRRRLAPAVSLACAEDSQRTLAEPAAHAPGPDARAYAGEIGALLRSEIERLPDGQRIVFVMRHYHELKLGEIADALGLAEGTVKRQLHAAVHRLRSALSRTRVTVSSAAPGGDRA